MKTLIVNSLEAICKITIFIILVATYAVVREIYHNNGAAFFAVVIAFLVCSVIFGFLFVLLEINENVRAIRKRLVKPALVKPALLKAKKES